VAEAVMAALALGLAFAGCDEYPKDARGTMERVRAGERPLRVGWSPAAPWVRGEAAGRDGDGPAGIEPDLVRDWAASVGARIEWVPGGEAQLVRALQRNAVDVAVAGFSDSSPWGGRIGQTQPYLKAEAVVGAAPGAAVPRDWEGVEIRHDRRRPDLAGAIRRIGAVPVAAEPEGMAPFAAAYAPELAALGLLPTGKTLATEHRVVATAPAENALTLALDRFLLPRGEEIARRLAAEARRR
jgi:polar amino acid transport system substrate-binding protein